MNFIEIEVPKYVLRDYLGDFVCYRVKILVEENSGITAESFDQNKDEYYLEDTEIDRLGKEKARRFLDQNYKAILQGHKKLTPSELKGIQVFLQLKGSELGRLLDLDRSSVSRILAGKQNMQTSTMVLAMERMRLEVEVPGITKHILKQSDAAGQDQKWDTDGALEAQVVAEWFIRRFTKLGEQLTHLKLQKLLYYSQGIALGLHNRLLIKEDFFAWNHGPVVKSVYDKYKSYGSAPISVDFEIDVSTINKNSALTDILTQTLHSYGRYTAWALRDKTHTESPWLETEQSAVISVEKIKSFFDRVLV